MSKEASEIDYSLFNRFAPLLQKNATIEDPSRVIVTASVAGLGVFEGGENGTFGYSASKGLTLYPSPILMIKTNEYQKAS